MFDPRPVAPSPPVQAEPPVQEEPAETAYPVERYYTIARVLGREMGARVTRGTVAGALALHKQGRTPKPELTRTEMKALLRRYLRQDA